MAFTTIELTGLFTDAGGNIASGALTFTLTAGMANSTVVSPSPISVLLDDAGALSVSLFANDDAGTEPQGVQYGVTEVIYGAQPRDYFISIPSGLGGTVDISTLIPGQAGWQ